MKITYIHHSSFSIEMQDDCNTVMLFDYFSGELPEWNTDCRLYVFASHKHFDHFTKKIFELVYKYPNVRFILAKEIKMNEKYMNRWNIPMEARDRIHYVGRNQDYIFEDIGITTLTSTDSGVAFIVRCAGRTIYHAGDLNWWTWKKEMLSQNELTDEDERLMEIKFKTEIDKYDRSFHVDVAFMPLDIRLEDGFFKGFDYCMKKWDITLAFPMHCWDRYDAIAMLKQMDIAADYRERIVDIEYDGQSWDI